LVAEQSISTATLLDLKVELADRMLDSCDLCPRHCRVDRNHGQTGFCGVAGKTAMHAEGVMYGEEIELVPSHELFLSGCTMRCAFCSSHRHITRPMLGTEVSPEDLAATAARRRAQGALNWNILGGEPIVHIANILKALRAQTEPIPVVWNSNLYATDEAMALLDGVVDLYLGDIHFGNDRCAERLSRTPDYSQSVRGAFAAAAHSGASVLIRHLVMPGHIDCCAGPAMRWAREALADAPFHLMLGYVAAAITPATGSACDSTAQMP
jgi:putative pyruvate formate lyase activating enzyme